MVIVESGKDIIGNPCKFYLDGYLKRTLDVAKERVLKKNWDYVALVCGLPGSGKSTFVRALAKYCCPWFNLNYVVFSDEEFIKVTTKCPEFSAIVLDESFQSLNSRITWTPEFLRIVNHLQIIRQKHLFIFLCLPNFFDLSKGVALFRSSHLFVTYAEEDGDRGRFLAFGRGAKTKLYVKGIKFMNYSAERANFFGNYRKYLNIIDDEDYEKKKLEHLQSQQKVFGIKKFSRVDRDYIIKKLYQNYSWTQQQIADLFEIHEKTVRNSLKTPKKPPKPPKTQ